MNDLADAVPGYIDDLTSGRGRLGFLERDYQIVERAREAIEKSGVGGVLGLSNTALSLTKSILNAVIAVVTIAFLTLFMLLEGPAWVERIYSLISEPAQPRWRKVGGDIYRTVGGYVTGNLAISLIAGVVSTAVLLVLGVPYAVALGLIVALLDLIPLAGATLAAIIVSAVGFLHSTTAGIVLVIFFVLYQQLENHVLQPLVYGRTVQLSPLIVLVAVLMGAELAGVIGALGAIPVAGSIQVVVVDWLEHRRQKVPDRTRAAAGGGRPALLSVSDAPEARGVARYRELFANRYAASLLAWSIVARLPIGMAASRSCCSSAARARATARPVSSPPRTASRSRSAPPTAAARSIAAARDSCSGAGWCCFRRSSGSSPCSVSSRRRSPRSPSRPPPPG